MIFCLGVLSALDTCQQLRLITIPMICLDSSWSAYVEITVPMTLLYFQLIIYSKYVFMLLNVNDFLFGIKHMNNYTPAPRRGRGYIHVYCSTSVRLSVLPSVRPSVQDMFCRIFLSNYWWQKSDIWSQSSYRYTILWVAFLDPSYSYFLFSDLVGFYLHWSYMHIFRHLFLSNYWWQKSDIWSQPLYRYPISWEAFLDPSDSYFLFADFVDF
jgi:hypothetical protein